MKTGKILLLTVFFAPFLMGLNSLEPEKVYEIVNTNNQMSENFEKDPIDGWQFMRGVEVVPANRGRILLASMPSFAHWKKANVTAFEMGFRYRHSGGTGEVKFCNSGGSNNKKSYNLRLVDNRIEVIKQMGQQQQLVAESICNLQIEKWHNVKIKYSLGKIVISINKKQVLNTVDRQPLPGGIISFGCLNGGGFAYDDIKLSFTAGFDKVTGKTTHKATPINTPGPKTYATPINTPGPAITSENQRKNQLSVERLINLKKMPNRQKLIQGMRADPSTSEILRTLSGIKEGESQRLETYGIDGKKVIGQVYPIISQKEKKNGFGISKDPPLSPAGGFKSIKDFNWNAGIAFTPLSPSLYYWMGGERYNVGEIYAKNIFVDSKATLTEQYNKNVLYVKVPGEISLIVEMMPGQALYIFTIKISTVVPSNWKGQVHKIKNNNIPAVSMKILDQDGVSSNNYKDVQLSTLSDNSGFTGICNIRPISQQALQPNLLNNNQNARWIIVVFNMNKISPSFHWGVFAGFTITKL
ncbi:MAG: hypothetical protein ABFR36_10310 [Acidobacteriota bacterium]